MPKKEKTTCTYSCNACGKKVRVAEDSNETPVCCGRPMIRKGGG